ncbi:hypothetical protein PMAYCL1PPCAC_13968, partial [Pristionchus mayeri]
AFDVMSLILESAHHSHIKLALNILKSEYCNCLHLENTTELSIRLVMFGIIESLHLTLVHFMEKRADHMPSKELPKRPNEIANSSAVLLLEPKEEPLDYSYSNHNLGTVEDEIKHEDTANHYGVS